MSEGNTCMCFSFSAKQVTKHIIIKQAMVDKVL